MKRHNATSRGARADAATDALGAKLRALRQATGKTMKEVSRALGLADRHLASIESGRTKNPGIAAVASLAAYYGVDLDALIGSAELPPLPESKALVRLINELDADDRQFVLRFVETYVMEQKGRKRSTRRA